MHKQEEAANAAAVDCTQTTAGSGIATVNSEKVTMAIDDTGDVNVVDYFSVRGGKFEASTWMLFI